MLGYWDTYVVGRAYGYGYLITNAMLIAAAVYLLRDFSAPRRMPKVIAEMICAIVVYFLMDSLYYWAFGGWMMDRIALAVFLLLYCMLRSNLAIRVREIRGWMFMAASMVILPLSEPFGKMLGDINEAYYVWAQYLTPLVILLLTMAEVAFLRHFSFDTGSLVGSRFVWMQVGISALTIALEMYNAVSAETREFPVYHMMVCAAMWIINLMAYYLFYSICKGTEENMQLQALRQKSELEKEKYHATRLNYDELRTIRHEIKNHNFYLKALLDEGKIQQARDYLDRVSTQGEDYLQSFDSGNYAIDVVMNHELAAAREMHVTIHPDILVPNQLPFRDEDICSLLSNLLDNAMEAAAQSGVEEPTVTISIIPRQEYLFLRVTNPVDTSLPEGRRMSLETTKTRHTELHGFGTRIIRRVAEKYSGSVKYSMADGIFTTDVMLEMPETPEVPKEAAA